MKQISLQQYSESLLQLLAKVERFAQLYLEAIHQHLYKIISQLAVYIYEVAICRSSSSYEYLVVFLLPLVHETLKDVLLKRGYKVNPVDVCVFSKLQMSFRQMSFPEIQNFLKIFRLKSRRMKGQVCFRFIKTHSMKNKNIKNESACSILQKFNQISDVFFVSCGFTCFLFLALSLCC